MECRITVRGAKESDGVIIISLTFPTVVYLSFNNMTCQFIVDDGMNCGRHKHNT